MSKTVSPDAILLAVTTLLSTKSDTFGHISHVAAQVEKACHTVWYIMHNEHFIKLMDDEPHIPSGKYTPAGE